MAFSLSNWFKGKPGAAAEPDAPPAKEGAPAPIAPAPPSVRTVRPSAASQQAPPAVNLRQQPRTTVAVPPTRLPVSGKVTPVQPSARKVSFPGAAGSGGSAFGESSGAFAAPAFAPAAPDISISLEIGDFIDRLPAAFVQSGSFDRNKKVEFPASELYSDLTKGRASVPASVIYQRCPEIFVRPITQTEDVEVQLPLQKLVEQMGNALSTRDDQVAEENVAEIETPFLQVANEDNARVPTAAGTTAGAVRPPIFRPAVAPVDKAFGDASPIPAPVQGHRSGHISTISPTKPQPEPAAPGNPGQAGPIITGKRPPSTVRASVAGSKIRLSGPSVINRIVPVPEAAPSASVPPNPRTHSQRIHLPITPGAASPSLQVTKKTQRIQIPPISLKTGLPNATPRTGSVPPPPSRPVAPANPDQPAPGMESVPNLRPPFSKEASTITFRTSPPSVRPVPSSFAPPRSPAFPPPSFPAVPPPAAAAAAFPPPPASAPADDRTVSLGLAAILRGVPSSLLTAEGSAIPEDVRIALPYALIAPQLSHGRIAIPRPIFLQALPEAHRNLFAVDEAVAEVPIPLQEVFQNLPADALALRADQVTQETGGQYPTPFSEKAEEDAQRFASSLQSRLEPAPPREEEPSAINSEASESETADTVADLPIEESAAFSARVDEQNALDVSGADSPRDIPLDLDPTTEAPVSGYDADAASVLGKNEDQAGAGLPLDNVPSLEPPVTEDFAKAAVDPAPPSAVIAFPPPPAEAPVPVLPPPAAPSTAVQPSVERTEAPAPTASGKEARIATVKPIPSTEAVLQALFMTEDELDAKTIVKLVCQLPAVNGCAIMFEDGLRLAGNFPDGDAEGFSAMAPPFYKKAARFVSELELGNLLTFTLHTDNGLISFFMHENICLAARHTGRGFMPGVREKLEIVTRELARMYSTAKPE